MSDLGEGVSGSRGFVANTKQPYCVRMFSVNRELLLLEILRGNKSVSGKPELERGLTGLTLNESFILPRNSTHTGAVVSDRLEE